VIPKDIWKGGKGTLASADVKDGGVIAFMVVNDDGSDGDEEEGQWDGDFVVEWPVEEWGDSQGQSQELESSD